MLIYAGLEGLKNKTPLPDPVNVNLYKADPATLAHYDRLPESILRAQILASKSAFIRAHIPQTVIDIYTDPNRSA